MNNLMRIASLICYLMVFSGCAASNYSTWEHFHGGLSNQGFREIESGFALSSSWTSNAYKITSASPVIGQDLQNREVVYIGTSDGMLVALRSGDGSEKWKISLGSVGSETHIISSASVSNEGYIYVITSRKMDDKLASSTLHKIDQFGYPKWAYTFPDRGFTSGSPKVVTMGNDTFIFVYVSVDASNNIRGELFALRDDEYGASLLDRKALGTCRFDNLNHAASLVAFWEETWQRVSTFPVKLDEGKIARSNHFLDPTVAVVTDRKKPLIAIADNLCNLGVYEWNGVELSVLWYQEHDFDKHSSTMVSPNDLMIFGRQDGKVPAHDLETGVKMWEYDAGQAVFATPAAAREKYLFVVSKDRIQVLNAFDGSLIQDDKSPRRFKLQRATHSSPAVTANRIYVSTSEMLTVNYSLKTRAHDTNFQGNRLSSVVVGSDGSVYGVAVDGTIRKYAGVESE